jgi:uncharacterized membrane protein
MNASWSPLDTFREASQTLLGRLASCFLACSLGAAVGYGIDLLAEGFDGFDFRMLLMLMSVVPLAVMSLLYNWGLIIYPLCLLVTFAYVRLELSPWYLLIPFGLVTYDVATLGQGMR